MESSVYVRDDGECETDGTFNVRFSANNSDISIANPHVTSKQPTSMSYLNDVNWTLRMERT
eukprot:m.104754 g.104754  ORF g.104754 m.104754 type:complete len:61 (+) comp12644_c0_seq1:207-389(+)